MSTIHQKTSPVRFQTSKQTAKHRVVIRRHATLLLVSNHLSKVETNEVAQATIMVVGVKTVLVQIAARDNHKINAKVKVSLGELVDSNRPSDEEVGKAVVVDDKTDMKVREEVVLKAHLLNNLLIT